MSKIVSTVPPFGRGKDLNGNPRIGSAASVTSARPDFDKSRVKCGIGQVWAAADGHKYTPVTPLEDTDTRRGCVEVSVLSPSGDVLDNRPMALSAFAAFALEVDPSVVVPDRREPEHRGGAGKLIKSGTPEQFVYDVGVPRAEIAASVGYIGAAMRQAQQRIDEAISCAGHVPWLTFAAAAAHIGAVLNQIAGSLQGVAEGAGGLALRDLTAEDAILLGLIATAPPDGYDMTTLAQVASDVMGPSAIAAFQKQVRPMIELGWLAPAPGTADGNVTSIVAGPRMFEVIFHPRAEAPVPGVLN